jgi:putative flippase GtrA
MSAGTTTGADALRHRYEHLILRLPAPLQRLARLVPQLSLYTMVSAIALAVDFSIFLMLTAGGLRAAVAGVIGYVGGGIAHYLLSVRLVFDVSASTKTVARRVTEFWISGVVGLAITWSIIALVTEALGFPPIVGKLAAIGVSFISVYLIRRGYVFADPHPRPDKT